MFLRIIPAHSNVITSHMAERATIGSSDRRKLYAHSKQTESNSAVSTNLQVSPTHTVRGSFLSLALVFLATSIELCSLNICVCAQAKSYRLLTYFQLWKRRQSQVFIVFPFSACLSLTDTLIHPHMHSYSHITATRPHHSPVATACSAVAMETPASLVILWIGCNEQCFRGGNSSTRWQVETVNWTLPLRRTLDSHPLIFFFSKIFFLSLYYVKFFM